MIPSRCHCGSVVRSRGARLPSWCLRWAQWWVAQAAPGEPVAPFCPNPAAAIRRWPRVGPGRPVLFQWRPDEGGVVRVSKAAGFSHVVHYGPQPGHESPLEAQARRPGCQVAAGPVSKFAP